MFSPPPMCLLVFSFVDSLLERGPVFVVRVYVANRRPSRHSFGAVIVHTFSNPHQNSGIRGQTRVRSSPVAVAGRALCAGTEVRRLRAEADSSFK